MGCFPPRHPHSSTPWDKLRWSLASHRHRSPLPPPKNGPARPVVGGVVGDPRDLQFQHIWRRVLHDQLISPVFFKAHPHIIRNLKLLQSSLKCNVIHSAENWCNIPYHKSDTTQTNLVGGWNQPIWKNMLVKLDHETPRTRVKLRHIWVATI